MMKCKNCEHYREETYPDYDCWCELIFPMDYDKDGDYSCNKTDAEIQERINEIDEYDRKYLEAVANGEINEED